MYDKDHGLDKNALDRYITGNYGEDQFTHDEEYTIEDYIDEEYFIEKLRGEHSKDADREMIGDDADILEDIGSK